jgi:putative hydrolase of the HAD superfamily
MSRARPVRAIFLDAGNTLIRMDYAAIAAALARHGVRVTIDELQRAEWRARVRLDTEVLSPLGLDASTENRTTADRYLALLLAEIGVRDDAVVSAMGAWRRAYRPPVGLWTVAEPAAEAALAHVRAAGVPAAVISNSNGSVASILESVGLARYLDFVIDSGKVGVEKPDPRIFRLAAERAGVAPEDAVYIGDLYSVDVVGARAAGLDAILLDPGACWGARDCPAAPDVLAAVRLVV